MALMDVALNCLFHGWHVFPCKPRAKEPLIRGGFHAATNAEDQIREWWTKWSDANVGIATGASGLTVLDVDTGIVDSYGVREFTADHTIPETFTVRTGRRPGFGVQLYFKGGDLKSIPWTHEGFSGDVRSGSGYVLAAGSIHPSGETYEALVEAPIADTPRFVRELRSVASTSAIAALGPDEKIRVGRHDALMSMGGSWRAKGMPADALEAALLATNYARVEPPLPDGDVRRMAANIGKWAIQEPEVQVVIGKAKAAEADAPTEPVDWREHYHTRLEMETTPPPVFLIDGFLLADSMTAIAARVGQRKSIIALNVAHALCTGEPLFGYFPVTKRATRVLYLCPEMGIRSFTDRVRKIGLLDYVGETLFCRTMNKVEGLLPLVQLREEEVRGAVVIIDTVVRYLEGDENSSEHMRAFARTIFELKTLAGEDGAVVLLHHSSKGAKDSSELSLENCMRGSGEIGAFVTSCWATRLLDPTDSHNSASFMTNVKQRDYESQDFTVLGDKTFRLRMKDEPGSGVTLGARSNVDGKEAAALAIIRDNPGDSLAQLIGKMKDAGIDRKKTWVSTKRAEVRGTARSSPNRVPAFLPS